MQSLIKISDAAVIAIHSMDYMLKHKKQAYSAKEISEKMAVSYNHLSKVLQRLSKGGMVSTHRGPAGGYYLSEKGKKARLGEIITAMEGGNGYSACFMNSRICGRSACPLKDFLENTSKEFKKLINLRLGDF